MEWVGAACGEDGSKRRGGGQGELKGIVVAIPGALAERLDNTGFRASDPALSPQPSLRRIDMPTGKSRVAYLATLALIAMLLALPAAFGPGPLRAQGTVDLSGDAALESQRQVEQLMDRMRALYAQGRYNEAIDVANQVMAADPENKIAFLFKDLSERRLLEGRTSPPVATTQATPVARAAPPPIEYVPPPVIVPRKRSSMSLKSIKDNPVVLTIVIVVAVLLVVAAVLGVVVMRRGRDRAIGGTRRDGLTDMPTQKASSLTDLPTRKGLADMPTAKGMADMPTARGGVADMQTRQDAGGGLYTMQEPAPPAPPPPARKEPAPTPVSTLVSDDEVRRPQFAPAPALTPPPPAEPAPASSSPESKSYLNLDLSDSQVSDIEATAHGRMAGTGAPPFAPAPSQGAPKAKESRSMALPPIVPAAEVAPQGPPDTQPPPMSQAPPVDITGDDPFAAPAPLFDAGGDDSFAAPPPVALGPPSGIVPVPAAVRTPAAAASSVPPDEKTVDPAISFNSLMFGAPPDPPSAIGVPPAPAKPAPVEDDNMSKTSFNRQFDEVMMGPGTEQTGIALDLGPAAAKEKTQAMPSPAKGAASAQQPQQDLDMTVEIEPVTAKPQSAGLGSASSSSMFTRQFESGKAAFNAGDYSKAVQCLSVAATLRPTDMEVRQLLDEARKRRRG